MFNSKFSYGVLKHPGYNGKSDPPPAPDYLGAARETAAGNLEAAKYTTEANRVNQFTPYGNLTYSKGSPTVNQTGYDQAMQNYQKQLDAYNSQSKNTGYNNNPLFPQYTVGRMGMPTAPNIADYTTDSNQWNVTQTLTPAQQKILEQNQNLSSGLLNTAQQGLDYAGGLMAKPGIDMASLPQVGINPGETYSDAIMRRLQPQIEQERQASDAALANQGIAQGTQAYENAKRQLAMNQNDRQLGAITSGMGVGLQANQQAFGQQGYNQMQPINVINALRTGSQVQAPSYVSVPQQANVAGPDLLGATGAQYNAEVNATNAANAGAGSFMGGLMNLASTGAKLYAGSDQTIKENIIKIGALDNGINIYKFEYRPEYKDTWGHGTHIGVMAQEVEKVIPKAVATHKDGYKLVNYSLLGA